MLIYLLLLNKNKIKPVKKKKNIMYGCSCEKFDGLTLEFKMKKQWCYLC